MNHFKLNSLSKLLLKQERAINFFLSFFLKLGKRQIYNIREMHKFQRISLIKFTTVIKSNKYAGCEIWQSTQNNFHWRKVECKIIYVLWR